MVEKWSKLAHPSSRNINPGVKNRDYQNRPFLTKVQKVMASLVSFGPFRKKGDSHQKRCRTFTPGSMPNSETGVDSGCHIPLYSPMFEQKVRFPSRTKACRTVKRVMGARPATPVQEPMNGTLMTERHTSSMPELSTFTLNSHLPPPYPGPIARLSNPTVKRELTPG